MAKRATPNPATDLISRESIVYFLQPVTKTAGRYFGCWNVTYPPRWVDTRAVAQLRFPALANADSDPYPHTEFGEYVELPSTEVGNDPVRGERYTQGMRVVGEEWFAEQEDWT